MMKVFNGIEMLERDLLLFIKCTRSIIIVKTCLVGLLWATESGDKKRNLMKQFKI